MTNMAQTMAKNGKIILPLQPWGLYLPHGHNFNASVESSVRFHSEIFYAKPKEFIDRQTDRTIHGKTLSRPVDS